MIEKAIVGASTVLVTLDFCLLSVKSPSQRK